MARIDIKQDIHQSDVDKITACLYKQKGVNHVLVNPESKIAVFTFFALQNNGDNIVNNFKATSGYKAERNLPSKEELKSGCPVSSNSVSGRLAAYLKHVF
ncbi:hypothetical protein [Filimonas lacunae]|nr:hypothetical protein [Filimonas lacunae]BAV06680.1 hypothetical protein FLA_2699 [Filimonas lacunae]